MKKFLKNKLKKKLGKKVVPSRIANFADWRYGSWENAVKNVFKANLMYRTAKKVNIILLRTRCGFTQSYLVLSKTNIAFRSNL